MSSPSRRQDFENDQDHPYNRVDHIVGIDTLSLLNTIKELEYKLSTPANFDKPPWAIALEQRLKKIEGQLNEHQNIISTQPNLAINTIIEGETDVDSSKRNVVDLANEMRLMSKVRKEIDNKINTSEINSDVKVSSFNLQIDRLHKLLQIRPTTSELQSIMLTVQGIEKKVQFTVHDMKQEIRSFLKDKLSEEMTSIIDELKNSSDSSLNLVNNIKSTVAANTAELSDMRDIMETTVIQLNEKLDKTNEKHIENLNLLNDFKIQCAKNISSINTSINDLKLLQRESFEDIKSLKSELDDETNALKKSQEADKLIAEEEIKRIEYIISECNNEISCANTTVSNLKNTYDTDMSSIRDKQVYLDKSLDDQQINVGKLQAVVEQFVADDYAGRLQASEEISSKTIADLSSLHETVSNYLDHDCKAMNIKISVLQEQCNVQLPQAYADLSVRIDKVNDQLKITNSHIDEVKSNLQATDAVVSELVPLLERTDSLERKAIDLTGEMESLRETATNTINTTDELIRRLEEMEETLEGLDNSITDRMNQVRDALMDTILEAQSENNQAMKNVRDNLEVMSNAGESSDRSGGKTRKRGKGGSNQGGVSMNNDESDTMDLIGQRNSFMSSNSRVDISHLRRPSGDNFEVPTMNGQRVIGLSLPVTTSSRQEMTGLHSTQNNRIHSNQNNMTRANTMYSQVGSFPPMMNMQQNRRNISSPQANSNSSIGFSQPNVYNNDTGNTIQVSQHRLSKSPHTTNDTAGFISNISNIDNNMETPGMNATYQRSRVVSIIPNPEPEDHTVGEPPIYQSGGGSVVTFANLPMMSSRDLEEGSSLSHVVNAGTGNTNNISMSISLPSVVVPNNMTQHPQGRVSYNPNLNNNKNQNNLNANIELFQPRNDDYSEILDLAINGGTNDINFHPQAQFISDMCLNFEEISVKRKRVAHIPSVMCESIADITQEIAEVFAKSADYDMVQNELGKVAGLSSANEVNYDENFVINKRNEKVEGYLSLITKLIINSSSPVPGMVRLDARTLFLSLVKKALDMFMSKHNQVLVVGNSRLGRIKIPSCVACDRPLIDKVSFNFTFVNFKLKTIINNSY